MRATSEVQRQRILDAAAEAFAQEGFAGARVDQIAASAGVNKRMLYHHVGAKAELFAAVLEDQAGRLDEHSLTSRSLWALLLQEAAHRSSPVLLEAVLTSQLSGIDGALEERMALAMFRTLLPAAAALTVGGSESSELPDAIDHLDYDSLAPAPERRKPRLRMMPQVTASGAGSTRSSANRSK